jgi:hypothetical protein
MQAKALEVRDAGTFIPVLCVDMQPANPEQAYLLHRCGYNHGGPPNVVMTRLEGRGHATNDYYAWGDDPHVRGTRTFPIAHQYIIAHWDELKDGDVVDVQFIIGETSVCKRSERETASHV